MKKYCFDTSGISNPLETMPEDIYDSMWAAIKVVISTGCIAVTKEIYDEMTHIPGSIGDCIKSNEAQMVLRLERRTEIGSRMSNVPRISKFRSEPSYQNTTETLEDCLLE